MLRHSRQWRLQAAGLDRGRRLSTTPLSAQPPLAAVAPAVLAIDYLYYGRKASPRVTASVLVVCLGVGLATVTDPQISSNLGGLAAGFGSVAATALYQVRPPCRCPVLLFLCLWALHVSSSV